MPQDASYTLDGKNPLADKQYEHALDSSVQSLLHFLEYTEILLFADSTVMTDAQLVSQAEKVFKEAIQIANNSDGWKLEKEDKVNQVTVEMKKNAEGRKIYLCKVKTSSMVFPE